MSRPSKTGRNDACPCGSNLKYKKCCQGKVDWGPLLTKPLGEQIPYLSLRGRNLLFVEHIASALQLDSVGPVKDFASLKRAFTPRAVQSIYEAIQKIWPCYKDYVTCLSSQQKDVTALYTGSYEPGAVFKALSRHTLYSERILLPDPFMYPVYIKDEFSPLIHPDQHRANTIKWSFLWMSLVPWIEMGLVNFIRTPGNFDPHVFHEIIEIQREKFKCNPELEEVANRLASETVDGMKVFDRGLMEHNFLSQPDEYLVDMYRRFPEGAPCKSKEEFLQFINNRRATHPYYVEMLPGQKGEFLHESTGACYEDSKRVCAITNSHIITDLSVRWKELEFDHRHATGRAGVWSPFAKALQNADLKILDNIPIQYAFRIRQEQRLDQMRHFFNRVWRACRDPEPYSDANAANLAAELDERVQEAKGEWDKIDKQLLKWLGTTGAVGGAFLSSGIVGFVPAAAAAVVSGVTGLALAQWQRKSFHNKFPAGLFLSSKR